MRGRERERGEGEPLGLLSDASELSGDSGLRGEDEALQHSLKRQQWEAELQFELASKRGTVLYSTELSCTVLDWNVLCSTVCAAPYYAAHRSTLCTVQFSAVGQFLEMMCPGLHHM